ncbi:MAG: adenine deaminase [Spirochaetia bacterium]
MKIRDIVPVALGREPADVLVKNARIVNVFTGGIEEGNIALYRKRIAGVGDYTEGREIIDLDGSFVVPGFIDAHLHIESSMVSPREFAHAVLPKGTTTVIADPHEIANVLGTEGLDYLIRSTEGIPLNVYIALPSAVPATNLETAGARLGPEDMVSFVDHYPRRIIALGEVMNFPGVLNIDNELIAKIEILRHKYKKIDGHAPGLRGKELNAYVSAFIRSDHECTTIAEALEKVSRGMQVFIREGTAAKNLDALIGAVTPENHMFFSFCTDDREPGDIVREGHINYLVKRAVETGMDPIMAVRMATINTARHYNLRSMGAIAPDYKADMVVLDSLQNFEIKMVIKDSKVVARDGRLVAPISGDYGAPPEHLGAVVVPDITDDMLKVPQPDGEIVIIGMREGDLFTERIVEPATVKNGQAIADPSRDIAKVAVLDRHNGKHFTVGFARGFGIRHGALATTIGHDSHNLCVLGMNDEDMLIAIRAVADANGGIAVVVDGEVRALLELPIAGLMSNMPLGDVVDSLEQLKQEISGLGADRDILMSLHFIQLAVIPSIKITDLGLIDVMKQEFINLSS